MMHMDFMFGGFGMFFGIIIYEFIEIINRKEVKKIG